MKVTELLSRSSVQTLSRVRLSGREDLKSPEGDFWSLDSHDELL